jgi:hypothetical protein
LSPLFLPVSESTEFGTQLAALRSFGDRRANGPLDLDLVHAHRRMHDKRRHAGILADRTFVLGGHIDIRQDDVQRLCRLRGGSFRARGQRHGRAYVGWKIGGCLGDQFQQLPARNSISAPDLLS